MAAPGVQSQNNIRRRANRWGLIDMNNRHPVPGLP